jgi:hypothetical protein
MATVYSSVLEVCWGLGVISVVASIGLRILPTLQMKLGVSPRGGLLLAAVLFLSALATGEARKTPPSP